MLAYRTIDGKPGRPSTGQWWKAHPHTLLLMLHTVQFIILIAVFILAVLQKRYLLQYRATQALLAIFAGCIPAKVGMYTRDTQSCQVTEPREGDTPDIAELLSPWSLGSEHAKLPIKPLLCAIIPRSLGQTRGCASPPQH